MDFVVDFESAGQRWRTGWHPPYPLPDGRNHGAAGICVTGGEIVMISQDRQQWDFPAGRPEESETFEETLRREVMEEACATVQAARLLGFSRGECVEGHERGLILVRSIWLADVVLEEWKPAFEIPWRRTVSIANALELVLVNFRTFWCRVFADAGLV